MFYTADAPCFIITELWTALMMHFIGEVLPSDSDLPFQTVETTHWMTESTLHLDDHQAHLAPFLHTSSATAMVFIPQALPLCITRLPAPTW